MKNTRRPTNRRKRRAIMHATSRLYARRSKNAQWCSAALRRRSKVTTPHHPPIPAPHSYSTGRRPTDAVDANCRSSSGTAKRKDRADHFREAVASDRRPPRKARADNPVPEPARLFHVAALHQLRRSAKLSELQRCLNLPSASGGCRTLELPSLRTRRGGSKKMTRPRKRWPCLRWVRDGKSA